MRKSRERRHRPARIADVPVRKVFGAAAERCIALDIDALDAPAVDEVVDIDAAPRRCEGLVDVGLRQAERADLLLVDIDREGRNIVEAVEAHRGQRRVGLCCGDERVGALAEGRAVEPAGWRREGGGSRTTTPMTGTRW